MGKPTVRSIQTLARKLMAEKVTIPESLRDGFTIRHTEYRKGDHLMLVNHRVSILSGLPYCEYICEAPTTVVELLSEEHGTWMTDMPIELVQMHMELARHARGNVLIGGLGLGIVAKMCAQKTSVKKVVVVEREAEVINAVWPHIQPHLKGKGEIVHADLNEFHVPPKHFSYGLFDTWQGTGEMVWTSEVVPLRRRFAQKIGRILSWQEEVMFNQMIRPLYRATALDPENYKGIPHYYAFGKAVDKLAVQVEKVPSDLSPPERFMESEKALSKNAQHPLIKALLGMFLYEVGLPHWERTFGSYWDESAA